MIKLTWKVIGQIFPELDYSELLSIISKGCITLIVENVAAIQCRESRLLNPVISVLKVAGI